MNTPKHHHGSKFFAIITAAFFIAGCGGGGGGSPAAPQQPAPPTNPPVPPPPPPPTPTLKLSLLVGSAGGGGNLDGSVDIARFEQPSSVVVDVEGNRYVADKENHVIRKISADGATVTTFAGKIGEAGDTDAIGGADARFRKPEGLAIDSLFLYVADTGNRMVRRIRLQNVDVRTLVGNPDGAPAVDGNGGRNGTARLEAPVAIAIGSGLTGSPIFIADRGAQAIRMVLGATVSTIAGTLNAPANCGTNPVPITPTAGNTALCAPTGLAFRIADGHLYFTESGRSIVRAVVPSATGFAAAAQNTVEFVAGSPTSVKGTQDGVGAAATFNNAIGIAASGNGDLIVGQRNALRRIRISSEAARVDILAGSLSGQFGNADGSRADARFGGLLTGVAIEASGGVLIADPNNALIRTFDPNAQQVGTLAGQRAAEGNDDGPLSDARFFRPRGISIAADGAATLVDEVSTRTRRIDIAAGQVTTLADLLLIETTLAGVVAADGSSPAAIVSETDHSVRVIENGEARLLAGGGFVDAEGSTDGPGDLARFENPTAVVRNAQGLLLIADRSNNRIRTVAADGTTGTFAGSTAGHVDGALELASFDKPNGLALAANGELFVLEAGNKAIRRISKDAQGRDVVNTVAQGLTDPVGIAIDAANNLYVIDATEQTVRRFAPGASQGEVFVGTPNQCGFVPGALPGVICRPRGIAVRGNRLLVTMDQGVVMVEPL